MTADQFIRYILIPAIGAGALTALIITLWQEWRDWKEGEW